MTLLSDPRLVEPVMTSADMMATEPAEPPPAPAPTVPTMTVQPLTGAGLAMRQGDLILVCAESGIGSVVSAFADVVAAQGDGTMLVRRIAAVLAEDYAGEVAACAACGPTRDGRLGVLVYGGARAVIDGPDGPSTVSGTDDFGAVCRLVPGSLDGLRLELPGAAEPNPRTRLDVGVIVAAGVGVTFSGGVPAVTAKPVPLRRPAPEVTTAPAPAQTHTTPAPAPRAEPDGRWTVPAHHNGTETHHPATNGRAATNGSATKLRTAVPTVRGLNCPEGHFNDPRLNYCSVCGMSMTAAGSSEHDAPRPPLGVLLLDRGGTFVVDGDIVVGREPELDRDVVVGVARPLTLDEPAQSVSRQHARITVIDWDVFVVDLGSTNGTRLQRPGEAPSRVAAHALTPITPGTIIWLGERWIRYESHRNPSGPADDHTLR